MAGPVQSIAVLLVTLTCVAGCGKKAPPRLSVVPVSGRVTVDGQPAAGAEVCFKPSGLIAGLKTSPLAKVESDGSFAPGTYGDHDGLPPGEYLVLVSWPKMVIDAGEEQYGPDQLKGRYSNPQRPVAQLSVSTEPVVMPPLDLKSR